MHAPTSPHLRRLLRPLLVLAPLAGLSWGAAAFFGTPAVGDDPLLGPLLEPAIERAQRRLEAGVELDLTPRTVQNPWRVKSNHYAVTGVQSFRQTQALARALDQMLPAYQALLDTNFLPGEPFSVRIHPNLVAYNEAGNEGGDGRSSAYSSFLSTAGSQAGWVETLAGVNDTQLFLWATHSAFQQYAEAAFRRRPETWIEQGLSAYFSLFWDWNYGAAQLRERIESNDYIPLPEILGAEIQDYAADSQGRMIQLGMLVSYLLHEVEATRTDEGGIQSDTSFRGFLRDVYRGQADRDHPFQLWLRDNAAELERDFRAFYTR